MTERRDILLQSLWATPLTSAEIADHLGLKRGSSVRQAAMRLNLPHRQPNRDTGPMQEANRRRMELKRDQPEVSPINASERPVCWICGGASQNWDGHDSCRGRKSRAA